MKIKVHFILEEVIEVDDPVFAELDEIYRTHERIRGEVRREVDNMTDKAIEILEKKCGVPFGTNDVPKTIAGAYTMDGEALIEW